MAQIFYDTVHAINAKDYTEQQLDVWATGTVDLGAWDRSFLENDTLIAETEGKIVGFADMDKTGYLDRLYVHKDCQGMGIATALVRELERRAQKAGLCRFETYASITARPFFEKLGYTVQARNVVAKGDISLVNFRMTKVISYA